MSYHYETVCDDAITLWGWNRALSEATHRAIQALEAEDSFPGPPVVDHLPLMCATRLAFPVYNRNAPAWCLGESYD